MAEESKPVVGHTAETVVPSTPVAPTVSAPNHTHWEQEIQALKRQVEESKRINAQKDELLKKEKHNHAEYVRQNMKRSAVDRIAKKHAKNHVEPVLAEVDKRVKVVSAGGDDVLVYYDHEGKKLNSQEEFEQSLLNTPYMADLVKGTEAKGSDVRGADNKVVDLQKGNVREFKARPSFEGMPLEERIQAKVAYNARKYNIGNE